VFGSIANSRAVDSLLSPRPSGRGSAYRSRGQTRVARQPRRGGRNPLWSEGVPVRFPLPTATRPSRTGAPNVGEGHGNVKGELSRDKGHAYCYATLGKFVYSAMPSRGNKAGRIINLAEEPGRRGGK
jgi:hypothetical protein